MYKGEVYAPGTILQKMYFKERINTYSAGNFLEVGPGCGLLSKIWLDSGWKGLGVELNSEAVNHLNLYLNNDRYKVC